MVEAPTTRLGPPTFNKQNTALRAFWLRIMAGGGWDVPAAVVLSCQPSMDRGAAGARDALTRVKTAEESVINLKKWRKHAEFAARNRPSW